MHVFPEEYLLKLCKCHVLVCSREIILSCERKFPTNVMTQKFAYVLNSGDVLYLSNSSSHSCCESGGKTPVTGLHSTILKPDSVSRVIPPTIIIPKTKEADKNSHFVTAGPDSGGSSVVSEAALPEDLTADGEGAEVKKLLECCSRAFNVLELRHSNLSTQRALHAPGVKVCRKLYVRFGMEVR